MTRLEPAPTGQRTEPRQFVVGDRVYQVHTDWPGTVENTDNPTRPDVKFDGVTNAVPIDAAQLRHHPITGGGK